jgi:paraquat-inducible protein A
MADLATCPTCGLLQQVDPLPSGARAECPRCGFEVYRRKPDSRSRTLALAIAGFILYWPANLFPIVETEYWGMKERTTIFEGIRKLFEQGNFLIGCLVFTTSILTPGIKVIGLLFLCLTLDWPRWHKFRTYLFKLIQIVDPWNMLEVTLLAVIVAIAEMGSLATVHPGPGVFSFGAVVIVTIGAAVTFDPRLIWDAEEKEDATRRDNERDGTDSEKS